MVSLNVESVNWRRAERELDDDDDDDDNATQKEKRN
jgi:hypothetical protein